MMLNESTSMEVLLFPVFCEKTEPIIQNPVRFLLHCYGILPIRL